MPKVGDQKQKKWFQPCSNLHGKSWNNFFCIQPLTFKVKSRRPRAKKFAFSQAWSSKHKTWNLKAWLRQFFLCSTSYFQTLVPKVRGWTPKKLLDNSMHGDLGMVHSKKFAFSFLFSVLKVGGWEFIFLHWPCLELQTQSLKNQSVAKVIFFLSTSYF